jgi:putative SOS response-associated peptidase YedK
MGMCGRFALYESEWRMVWERLNGAPAGNIEPTKPDEGEIRPGYNIAPMQRTACMLSNGEDIKGAIALWSLIPPWHKDPLEQKRYATFNAKSEEILQKPAFKGAMQKHRCLVPANLFYEWKKDGKEKQPYAIGMKDESLFAFAGVWTYWRGTWKEEPFEGYTFTILTTSPNPLMEKIHSRMPVIVPRESYMTWLTAPTEEALRLTAPFPSQLMTAWPVGKDVGNVRNQGPELATSIGGNILDRGT